MPTSTFTQTGRDELRASILQLPDRVTRACRLVALGTANGILVDARRRLLSQTKGEGNTAAARADRTGDEEDLDELIEDEFI